MKLMKQVVALLLCFLVLGSASVSAFAQAGGLIAASVAKHNVCDECGSSDAHTETCSRYAAPIPGDETESDRTAAAHLFSNWKKVNQTGYFKGDIVTLYSNPATSPDDTLDLAKGKDMPESFTVLYTGTLTDADGSTEQWYMLDTENWTHKGWNTDNSIYGYVKVADVTFDALEGDPEYKKISGVLGDSAITASGKIPETVAVAVSNVEIDPSDFGIENSDTIISSFDLKLLDGETEWQPTDGEMVTITLDAAALGLGDGMPVNIYHEHDGEVSLLGEFTVVYGKLTFTTPGFSIFTVTGLWGVATSTDVEELTMYVGDTIYLREDNNSSNNWSVQNSDDNIITIATYTKPDGTEPRMSYCVVTANRTGDVTLSCGNDSVIIHVSAQPVETYTVKIDDQIFSNGCLVPVLADATLSGVTYKWYKVWYENADIDGTGNYDEVTGEALNDTYAVSGGINVAVDQGGKYWYKVEAYNAEGTLIGTSNPYWVPYSNELENGSFENLQIENYNPFTDSDWSEGNVQFNQDDSRFITTAKNVKNGTALWWRTTGYGSGGAIGRDIEIIKPSNASNPSNPPGYYVSPADQLQYAELNCETIGTLYQDVLTAPNTTFNWSVHHRGREGTDTMAVVIMPADVADYWASQLAGKTDPEDINVVLTQIDALDGAVVWYNQSAENYEWTHHSGSYTTVAGQYLSRFFFVSVNSAGADTQGNFIDGVTFDDKLNYTIEYYLDGELQDDTERGRVKPYTPVDAGRTGNYDEYALAEVKIKIAGDESNWGSTSMKVEKEGTILRLYYVTTGISITKHVEIDNSDGSITDEELAAAQEEIWSEFGSATFKLFTDTSENPVATAKVTVNSETGEGVAMFYVNLETGEKFEPKPNVTYTIKETSVHEIPDYIWIKQEDVEDVTVKLEDGSYTISTDYTNKYKRGLADLTITKKGTQPIDENQSFIFTVKSKDDGVNIMLDVVINGDGSITIKDLPIGTYTVTENTDWSWRYTPDNNDQTIELEAGGKEVTFENNRSDIYWLSGDSYCENFWGGETAIVERQKEDD